MILSLFGVRSLNDLGLAILGTRDLEEFARIRRARSPTARALYHSHALFSGQSLLYSEANIAAD